MKFPKTALACLVLALAPVPGFAARDAAFVAPGGGGNSAVAEDALKVEPKSDIEIGDSVINVARRVEIFFVNQTNTPVKIENVEVSGDGNVKTDIASDDCSKQGSIPPASRCSVGVSLTPSTPGPWTATAVLTHNGPGRIARAKFNGKTGSTANSEKKDMGLALSSKEVMPVNFGELDVHSGKAVRSALMINDSPDPLTIYSIDVIEAENGLVRLDQGCAVDMELKPGESCPVTLVWTPVSNGQISTDLIIRHSGRLGFAVVPIRGIAKGGSAAPEKTYVDSGSSGTGKGGPLPLPPSADELEKVAAGSIPKISSDVLGAGASGASASGNLYLIGTVGNRAVIMKPDGGTAVMNAGEEVDIGDRKLRVVSIGPKSAEVLWDGKTKILVLEASPELKAKASSLPKLTSMPTIGGTSGNSSSGSSSGSGSSSSGSSSGAAGGTK